MKAIQRMSITDSVVADIKRNDACPESIELGKNCPLR